MQLSLLHLTYLLKTLYATFSYIRDMNQLSIFSELFAVARLSVCLSSVTFVRPTQAVQIFGNISTVLGTLAIR